MPGTRWCARFRLAVHSFSKILSIVTSDIYVTNQLTRSCIIFKPFWTLLGAFKLFQSPSNLFKDTVPVIKFHRSSTAHLPHLFKLLWSIGKHFSKVHGFTGSPKTALPGTLGSFPRVPVNLRFTENCSPRYAGECSPRTRKSQVHCKHLSQVRRGRRLGRSNSHASPRQRCFLAAGSTNKKYKYKMPISGERDEAQVFCLFRLLWRQVHSSPIFHFPFYTNSVSPILSSST